MAMKCTIKCGTFILDNTPYVLPTEFGFDIPHPRTPFSVHYVKTRREQPMYKQYYYFSVQQMVTMMCLLAMLVAIRSFYLFCANGVSTNISIGKEPASQIVQMVRKRGWSPSWWLFRVFISSVFFRMGGDECPCHCLGQILRVINHLCQRPFATMDAEWHGEWCDEKECTTRFG